MVPDQFGVLRAGRVSLRHYPQRGFARRNFWKETGSYDNAKSAGVVFGQKVVRLNDRPIARVLGYKRLRIHHMHRLYAKKNVTSF
jgi:hypothetical protein